MDHPLHIIILAAGDGTRMQSDTPKVLHRVGGRTLLGHVLATAHALHAARVHVVHNPERRALLEAFDDPLVAWVPQHQRLGTGHAVQQAMPGVPDEAQVLVLYGDTPLVPLELLARMLEEQADLTLLTMELPDPTGYGRILRDGDNHLVGIVEERDASPAQRALHEVNTGILQAPAALLRGWLETMGTDNEQGEYYLTDVVAAAHGEGRGVRAVRAPDASLLEGVNDMTQLARVERRFQRLAAERLMRQGVRLADPARFDQRGEVTAGRDVTLDVNVVLEGAVRLDDGVHVGPGCVLRDCELGPGTRVHAYSVLEGVRTAGPCDIGPFARLRPGTELAAGARVGNFVETKNSRLGEGSKANHLTYLGDAEIGARVNVGAGTITCNYDGAFKHRTEIGDDAFIGSNSSLVAPVTIGTGATIGAGSTITRDAPDGKLSLTRAKQLAVPGWKRPAKTASRPTSEKKE